MSRTRHCLTGMMIGTLFLSVPALADKPSWAGGGKGKSDDRYERAEHGKGKNRHERAERESRRDRHFRDDDRVVIREYYGNEFRRGRCPPGLAKKHNGCMPPGQVKKWRRGAPLPREVIFHDLPPELVVRIGVPPVGHRFVRVASDILLIAVGTGMVVDAIEDLGRM